MSRSPRPRARRALGYLTVLASLVASSVIVWQASHAAFSAKTANPGNNWTAGTVTLSDDDNNAALFTIDNLVPGSSGTKCIVVTSNSSLSSNVRMYAPTSTYMQTSGLGDNLMMTFTEGNSTSVGGNCNGFVADTGTGTTLSTSLSNFVANYYSYNRSFGTWTAPAGSNVQKTYRITYTLADGATQAATDAMQNGSAQVQFIWGSVNT